MNRDRIIQMLALVLVIGGVAAAAGLLPRINDLSQKHTLRYTDVAIEGAPPIVTLGTVIGALRGIIVDYLWIKVHFMKEKGLYYEVMADADMITKLQPRFPAVWAFQGHNMAYNISVAHNTPEERWEWVKAGIDLVRNSGLRYNPNDLTLHRELAFWFAHKIEGVADDAHFHYKTELAREWHSLLGEPPYELEARIEWIKKVADAAGTLEDAERRTPGVAALVERLRSELSPYEQRFKFALDSTFLGAYAQWQGVKGQSAYAQLLGIGRQWSPDSESAVLDAIASDPEVQDALETLIAYVKRLVLIDEYNMDPQLMYEYTRDYGPIDWRHGQAHALYWALTGSRRGEDRVRALEDDIYQIVNNDRLQIQAMQGLARWGRVSFDPFSSELPSRLPDPRWIEVIDKHWVYISFKHRDTRGMGPDLFMGFHQNFLTSSVRELYRSGEHALAQKHLDRLDSLYGRGAMLPDIKYAMPLDIFVWKSIEEEYAFQPHLAPSDVAASLYYAFRVGIGKDRPEVFREAVTFAQRVTNLFRNDKNNEYKTKMGTQRLADLVKQLQASVYMVFAQLMVDTSIPLLERLIIYARVQPEIQLEVYDDIYPHVLQQFESSELSRTNLTIDVVLTPPPGLEEHRRRKLQAQQAEAERRRAGEIERR